MRAGGVPDVVAAIRIDRIVRGCSLHVYKDIRDEIVAMGFGVSLATRKWMCSRALQLHVRQGVVIAPTCATPDSDSDFGCRGLCNRPMCGAVVADRRCIYAA